MTARVHGRQEQRSGPSPARPLAAGVALLLLLAVVGLALLPGPALGSDAAALQVRPGWDFTPPEQAHQQAFSTAVRPWGYASLAVSLAVPLVLGLTPRGARLLDRFRRGRRWPWPAQVLLLVLFVTLAARLASLPLSAGAEVVRRRFGLSTYTWPAWLADVAVAWAVGGFVTAGALLLLVWSARRWRQWWVPAAAGAALATAAGSFLYPVVVEPLFLRFTAMPDSPLRERLTDLAGRSTTVVDEVLVADASRRTTAANAYVSGLGATSRLVVYDTLLASADDDEVAQVVAHELAHAEGGHVLRVTVLGGIAAAAGTCLLAGLLRWQPLLRRAGVTGVADPRAVALVLALSTLAGQVSAPVSNAVSRRLETSADVRALELTRAPESFVAMQRGLAVTNLTDLEPSPWRVLWFATHPSPPRRIAAARAWAVQEGLPPPPPLVPPLAAAGDGQVPSRSLTGTGAESGRRP